MHQNNFKAARELRGLSQKYVAYSIGVSAPTVSEWESGRKNPTSENIVALAKLYSVSVDCLLGIAALPSVDASWDPERLVNLRVNSRKTINSVSDALGISLIQYRGYEEGSIVPSATDLAKLALLFCCDCDYLMGISWGAGDRQKKPAPEGELSKEETDFFTQFRTLPDDQRHLALSLCTKVVIELLLHQTTESRKGVSVPLASNH